MRFPLNKMQIGGYDYGEKTYYAEHHLGVDWQADNVPLFAPCAGTIINAFTGPELGLTIWFRPDGQETIVRWGHLSKFLCMKGQHVVEGELLAVTGNTGSLTKGPHLHEDIWKNKVTLKFEDTINPHIFYVTQGESMVLVENNGTYYIEGDKGYFGINGTEYLNLLLKIVSPEKIEHRLPKGVQLGVVETAPQSFLIKDK